MSIGNSNPQSNSLSNGVSEEAVQEAVNKSGYPLQTIIASKLSKEFGIQQEWSYIDKDSGDLRTLDVFAEKLLFDFKNKQPRVRPALNLLIECKQSELPYIFFRDINNLHSYSFPIIAGLFKEKICIRSDDTLSTHTMPILSLFGLTNHAFVYKDPEFCLSFSKCVRKGKELELSGTDAYNNLVFPLLKATESFVRTQCPPNTVYYFDAHLTLPIGVVDAPMIGISVTEQGNDLEYLPWVRVLRHETDNSSDWISRERMYAIDIVHKDFFSTYIERHALPFANELAECIVKHQHVIASGEGFIRGIEKNWHSDLEPRLENLPILPKVNRPKLIIRNILKNIKEIKNLE